jgi:hypothetical protein
MMPHDAHVADSEPTHLRCPPGERGEGEREGFKYSHHRLPARLDTRYMGVTFSGGFNGIIKKIGNTIKLTIKAHIFMRASFRIFLKQEVLVLARDPFQIGTGA